MPRNGSNQRCHISRSRKYIGMPLSLSLFYGDSVTHNTVNQTNKLIFQNFRSIRTLLVYRIFIAFRPPGLFSLETVCSKSAFLPRYRVTRASKCVIARGSTWKLRENIIVTAGSGTNGVCFKLNFEVIYEHTLICPTNF